MQKNICEYNYLKIIKINFQAYYYYFIKLFKSKENQQIKVEKINSIFPKNVLIKFQLIAKVHFINNSSLDTSNLIIWWKKKVPQQVFETWTPTV